MEKRKILALIIAIAYLIVLVIDGLETLLQGIIFLILPLILIFYSEEMGALKGFFGGFPRPIITKKSPAGAVEFMGWVILLLPLVYGLISAFTKIT